MLRWILDASGHIQCQDEMYVHLLRLLHFVGTNTYVFKNKYQCLHAVYCICPAHNNIYLQLYDFTKNRQDIRKRRNDDILNISPIKRTHFKKCEYKRISQD